MSKALRYIILLVTAVVSTAASLGVHAERSWLVSRPDQISTAAGNNDDTVQNLGDDEVSTTWESNPDYNSQNYIQIALDSELRLAPDEDIVIFLRRHADDANCHPITFHVQGSVNGTDWNEGHMVYAYFLYRGPGTEEYSARIHTPTLETAGYRYVRLTVTANNTKSLTNGSTDIRRMKLADINILRLRRDDDYSYDLVDRVHLKSDYNYGFGSDYKFVNTQGILSAVNRYGATAEWGDPAGWVDGKWVKDEAFLKEKGIEMPDYAMLTSANDADVVKGERQPTNVSEHVLYAIPGDAIALYPYYDLATTDAYHEYFSHWYDYTTGGRVTDSAGTDLLDVVIDPQCMVRTEDYGFFAGRSFLGSDVVVSIKSENDYNEFVRRVNAGETHLSAVVYYGLSFTAPVEPIGTPEHPYRGYFNGNNKMIWHLNVSGGNNVGMFGTVGDGAVIRGVSLTSDCVFTGDSYVGLIGGYVSDNPEGYITIERCVGDHRVVANTRNAGGILGCNLGVGAVKMTNCGFMGKLQGPLENGMLSGWMGINSRSFIENCFELRHQGAPSGLQVDANGKSLSLYRGTSGASRIYTDDAESAQGEYIPIGDMCSDAFAKRLGSMWYYYSEWQIQRLKEANTQDQRWYGTVGTFFQPRDIHTPEGEQRNLEKEEYVIAADFAQRFSDENLDKTNRIIHEPVINSRHIFRVRDGKSFADANMADTEGNRAFVRRNMRYVSARAGVQFQIRFDSPIPAQLTTRSKWYYKISDTDYRRVCSMDIRVYDGDTGEEIADHGFYAGQEVGGQGSRTFNEITYNICGGGGSYYRMLNCDNPQVGSYIVRLIGKDVNGNVIKLADGSGNDLWIQEYRISFLPAESASFITETEYDNNRTFATHRVDYLENPEVCGAPKSAINYDEYRNLIGAEGINSSDYLVDAGEGCGVFFRWPVAWRNSNYAYGYENRHDFNEYMITNNSLNTPYHGADVAAYDRLYADTEGDQQGFFYYVNAASDPGVMARLKLTDLCVGSTITVSAWAKEFSGSETCNLSFNFVAYKTDGERVPLHSFVTGYIPNAYIGQWMHVYYSFVPDLSNHEFDASEVDHYELELDNNCKSSGGADYAVDDIRIYVVRPQIYATQTTLMCDAATTSDVRVESPFEVLLQTIGSVPATSEETAQTIDIYYTFVDKQMYESLRDDGLSAEEAFTRAQLRYKYTSNGAAEQTFGRLSFKTFFDANPEYVDNQTQGDVAYRLVDKSHRRMIVFNTKPEDSKLKVGREYIVALWLPSVDNNTDTPGYTEFQIEDDCAKRGEFRVQGSGIIKVDGQVYYNDDPIEVCEHQQPVVQVHLRGVPRNASNTNDLIPVIRDANFDWYYGRVDAIDDETFNGKTLRDILVAFRAEYPTATDTKVQPTERISQDELDYLEGLTQAVDGAQPLLTLYKSSFVFPPVEMELDEGGEPKNETVVYVTAFPIDYIFHDAIKICTEPTEVRIAVRNHAPLMSNGFDGLIEYPKGMDDVPLRISLGQLESVAGGTQKQLSVPLRAIMPATHGVSRFRLTENTDVVLVASNDPLCQSLSPDDEGLIPIGELKSITADKGRTDNMVNLVFDGAFSFREGYYYRLRFDYREDVSGVTLPDNVDPSAVCNGQLVFTVKVVPEYQKWTGEGGNRNWNNDANWSRVTADDILRAPSAGDTRTVSEANDNTVSYAPLDFTHVLVPMGADGAEADYPMLFAEPGTPLTVDGRNFVWTHDADDTDAGEATPLVHFDMASYATDGGVACRPWYANTCLDIHFDAGARLHRQQHFTHYQRAWVDIATAPSRWYTLSSPLQGVVAGDMYLPTATASQNTELFRPISFSTDVYDRFRPAVFQRSWNKATATVYEMPGSPQASRNVAVSTQWSRVFNDVAEAYAPGNGFSVQTDLSNTSLTASQVKFRLPKDDASYDYYDFSGTVQGNTTAIARTNAYKLNDANFDVTIPAAASSNYFLVGNPFITRLDMAEFLRVNSGVVEPAYWILSADAQGAAVWDESVEGFVGTVADAPTVGVAQGFFVKARSARPSLTVRFTEAMLHEGADIAGEPLVRSTEADGITLTALRDGREVSKAVLRVVPDGVSADVLLNPDELPETLVYTAEGGRALAVNAVPEIVSTGLGLMAEEGSVTTVRFTGAQADGGYRLLDVADGSLRDIYDGFEYDIEGSTSGRYFIVADVEATLADGLMISLADRTVTVSSPRGAVQAKAFNTLGVAAGSHASEIGSVSFTLEPGVYLISARDASEHRARMIMIR